MQNILIMKGGKDFQVLAEEDFATFRKLSKNSICKGQWRLGLY